MSPADDAARDAVGPGSTASGRPRTSDAQQTVAQQLSGATTRLAAAGEGFLYYVSMTGVTGTQQVNAGAISAAVSTLKEHSPVPVAVGFGVSTPEDAKAVAAFADAVVVGSALVKLIADFSGSPRLLEEVGGFARQLKAAI